MLTNREDILRYGLPYKNTWNNHTQFRGIVEMSMARFYLAMYDMAITPKDHPTYDEKYKLYVDQLFPLGHFLIDYCLIISMGEARHIRAKLTHTGVACGCVNLRGSLSTGNRIKCAKNNLTLFNSYDAAFNQLRCCFNKHMWTGSYGGWHWANLVYVTHMLYRAFQDNNIEMAGIWLDKLFSLEHNSGSVFKMKIGWIYTDIYMVESILNCKFHGTPTCYEWLRYYACYTSRYPDMACIHYTPPEGKSVKPIDPLNRICKKCHRDYCMCAGSVYGVPVEWQGKL
jgi:hypothetical protein